MKLLRLFVSREIHHGSVHHLDALPSFLALLCCFLLPVKAEISHVNEFKEHKASLLPAPTVLIKIFHRLVATQSSSSTKVEAAKAAKKISRILATIRDSHTRRLAILNLVIRVENEQYDDLEE